MPEPGTSKVTKAIFRSLALAERTNPDVVRLTANTSQSALPVAIACNDVLFVLVLLFMNFSSGVPLAVGFKTEAGEVISADVPLPTLCRNALADSGAPQFLRGDQH